MKPSAFLLFAILCLTSCQHNNTLQQLKNIDSIASHGGDKSAMAMLENIAPMTLDDQECVAYYWLLKYRTQIRLHKKIDSVEPLEQSITYYKKHKNKEKLARTYGYKAHVLQDLGDLRNASLALKNAEVIIADNPKEKELAFHIYTNLANINFNAKELDFALKYSKLALKTAYQSNNISNISYAFINMSSAYYAMNNKDSSSYYIRKCESLIKKIPAREQVAFYDNIGLFLIEKDDTSAIDYLMKAYKIQPTPYTYRGLARIYYKKGEREKALEMWQKALQTDNLYLKTEILQALYNSQQEEGDYKEASQTAMQIAELKDSIAQKEKDEDIRGLQEQFEQEQKRKAERHLYYVTVSAISVFLLIAITAAAYLLYNNTKGKKKLAETIQHLEGYRNRLKVMEQEGKTDSKEVERLNQKIAELQAKQGALLQNGRERYEEIEQGGTTLRWSRNDFTDCIEFYRTVDAAFVTHMEQDYRHLSSKYIFFALMEHLGKTDEELQHMMAISQNTIRSYRSRINKAQITT